MRNLSLRTPDQQYDEAVTSVGSEYYLDLYLAWRIRENIDASFNVINLTDNDPPILGGQAFDFNTAPSTYDVMGRRYQLGVNLRF